MKKEHFILSALMGMIALSGVGIGLYFNSSTELVSAAATDRNESVIMATGKVFVRLGSLTESSNVNYSSLEAVYTLDQNTGQMMVGVLAREGQGFQGLFNADIFEGLRSVMQAANDPMPFPQRPRFTMVTGEVTSPNQAGSKGQVPQGVVYIHEQTTGYLMVYTIPWTRDYFAGGKMSGPMVLWTAQRFSAPYIGM
jgi:hypothetical protein